MSTAFVMNDSWKPSVIQLVPFPSGKLKTNQSRKLIYQKSQLENRKRNFPVLAVTRTSSGDSQGHLNPPESKSPSEMSSVNDRVTRGKSSADDNFKIVGKKDTRVRIVVDDGMHKKVDDLRRCSFQDLNEQSSSDIDIEHSSDGRIPSVHQEHFLSPRYLPKPKVNGTNRYFINHNNNSAKGQIKLTPGEKELKRFKDEYVKEQLQKANKYKLNVNQLPRSTTPITDNDPDKLNMKHVIKFLQNQKPSDPTMKPQNKLPNGAGTVLQKYKTNDNNEERFLFELLPLHEDRRYMGRDSHSGSAMSIRSTPIIKRSSNRSPDSQASSVQTVKSVIERPTNPKRNTKRSKEFKLHRFLSLAPEKRMSGSDKVGHVVLSGGTSPRKEVPLIKENKKFAKAQILPSQMESEVQFRSTAVWDSHGEVVAENGFPDNASDISEQTTTSVGRQNASLATAVHRNVRKHTQRLDRQGDKDKTVRKRRPYNGAIRLPTMGFVHETEDDHEQSDNETEQDKNVDKDKENEKHDIYDIGDGSSEESLMETSFIEPDEEPTRISVSIQPRISLSLLQNSSFYPQQKRVPVKEAHHSDTNNAAQRHLMINMPSENRNPGSDVIKLSLRKEKDMTADRSYMFDMASMTHRGSIHSEQSYDSGYIDKDIIQVSSVPMQHRKSQNEDEMSVNNSMAKSCIKVRKKLKANMFNISE